VRHDGGGTEAGRQVGPTLRSVARRKARQRITRWRRHPKIGAELAKRYGETSKEVLHAIVGHHDDVTIDHVYTVLVAAADAIALPALERGARDAGEICQALGGVGGSCVRVSGSGARLRYPGGREVRVIADASRTSDSDAIKVCHDTPGRSSNN